LNCIKDGKPKCGKDENCSIVADPKKNCTKRTGKNKDGVNEKVMKAGQKILDEKYGGGKYIYDQEYGVLGTREQIEEYKRELRGGARVSSPKSSPKLPTKSRKSTKSVSSGSQCYDDENACDEGEECFVYEDEDTGMLSTECKKKRETKGRSSTKIGNRNVYGAQEDVDDLIAYFEEQKRLEQEREMQELQAGMAQVSIDDSLSGVQCYDDEGQCDDDQECFVYEDEDTQQLGTECKKKRDAKGRSSTKVNGRNVYGAQEDLDRMQQVLSSRSKPSKATKDETGLELDFANLNMASNGCHVPNPGDDACEDDEECVVTDEDGRLESSCVSKSRFNKDKYTSKRKFYLLLNDDRKIYGEENDLRRLKRDVFTDAELVDTNPRPLGGGAGAGNIVKPPKPTRPPTKPSGKPTSLSDLLGGKPPRPAPPQLTKPSKPAPPKAKSPKRVEFGVEPGIADSSKIEEKRQKVVEMFKQCIAGL